MNENEIFGLQPGTFHWKDGLFFYRMPDGGVHIIKDDIALGAGPGPNMLAPVGAVGYCVDVIIPEAEWESIVHHLGGCSKVDGALVEMASKAIVALHETASPPSSVCPVCGGPSHDPAGRT